MRLTITDHAAGRYAERVKPHMSNAESRSELIRLAGAGSYALQKPAWLHDGSQEADLWLVICDSIAVPLVREGRGFVATTVLTRSGHSDFIREKRNRISSQRRYAKAHQVNRPTRAAKKATRRKERRSLDLDEA